VWIEAVNCFVVIENWNILFVMIAYCSLSSIGQFVTDGYTFLQNTQGSIGFLGNEAAASLLGEGLVFFLGLLVNLDRIWIEESACC
jgi:hypothetical protein